MPCICDDPPNPRATISDLGNQKDELAQELCKARSLLLRLTQRGDIPADLQGPLQEQLDAFRTHREHDKRRAVDEVDQQLRQLAERVKKIKELGGIPQPKLADQQNSLQKKREVILASNSLETNLY